MNNHYTYYTHNIIYRSSDILINRPEEGEGFGNECVIVMIFSEKGERHNISTNAAQYVSRAGRVCICIYKEFRTLKQVTEYPDNRAEEKDENKMSENPSLTYLSSNILYHVKLQGNNYLGFNKYAIMIRKYYVDDHQSNSIRTQVKFDSLDLMSLVRIQ